MADVTPTQGFADRAALERLIAQDGSTDPFVSLYLNTERESIPRNLRERAIAALDGAAANGGAAGDVLRTERPRLEPLLEGLHPMGPGLGIFASEAGGVLEALWLPVPVHDHLRVGAGLYALPLMDQLDELEPVALAFVEKDKARLLVADAGRLAEAEHTHAGGGGEHRRSGRQSARQFQGRSAQRAEDFAREVAAELEALRKEHPFRRLFLSGPKEPVTLLRKHLTAEQAGQVAGELALDAHASDAAMVEALIPHAREAERAAERTLVEGLVTAAAKKQNAVMGLTDTLAAFGEHKVSQVVLASDQPLDGHRCTACGLLTGRLSPRCIRCGGATEEVDLREVLPPVVRQSAVAVEVVHGDAASALREHGGLAGLLKPVKH